MTKVRTSMREQMSLIAAGGAIPVVIVAALLLAGQRIPVLPSLIGFAVLWYIALFAGLLEARKDAAYRQRMGGVQEAELELDHQIAIGSRPAVIEAVRSVGVCPLGFRAGHTWMVGSEGGLLAPLCRPAASALSSRLDLGNGKASQEVSCDCPLGDRALVFRVARAA